MVMSYQRIYVHRLRFSDVLTTLLHLYPKKASLGTTDCAGMVSLLLIKGLATRIQIIHLLLTLRLLIRILR